MVGCHGWLGCRSSRPPVAAHRPPVSKSARMKTTYPIPYVRGPIRPVIHVMHEKLSRKNKILSRSPSRSFRGGSWMVPNGRPLHIVKQGPLDQLSYKYIYCSDHVDTHSCPFQGSPASVSLSWATLNWYRQTGALRMRHALSLQAIGTHFWVAFCSPAKILTFSDL